MLGTFFQPEKAECNGCGLPTTVDADGKCNRCASQGDRILVSGYFKDGHTPSGDYKSNMPFVEYVGVVGQEPEDIENDDDVFYYFDNYQSIIGDRGDFVVTSYADNFGILHFSKEIFVVAWESESSGGFDWYRTKESAESAFIKEKIAKSASSHKISFFTLLVEDDLTDDAVTALVDSDLSYYCSKATIGFDPKIL